VSGRGYVIALIKPCVIRYMDLHPADYAGASQVFVINRKRISEWLMESKREPTLEALRRAFDGKTPPA